MGTLREASHGWRTSPRHSGGLLLVCFSLLSASFGLLPGAVETASAIQITEFPVPTSGGEPNGITSGYDGNMWFTETNANKIASVSPSGQITEFSIETAATEPGDVVLGPDKNLWFTEPGLGRIGRFTPGAPWDEQFTWFAGLESKISRAVGIAVGSESSLFYTDAGSQKIGWITLNPGGSTSVVEVPTPTKNSGPGEIAKGPDGNLWFGEVTGNKIGRLAPGTSIVEFPIPTPASQPGGIAAGPDGNVWFTEVAANKIGRITPAGVVTEFPIPTSESGPRGIVSGPDGNLWFTESQANKIGRITPAGEITEFPVPTPASEPSDISVGPDNNIWFTERTGNQIGRFSPGVSAPNRTLSVTKAGTGTGTVLSEPAGIDCGESCSAKFSEGQKAVLIALPAAGSKFVGWKGCDSSGVSANECVVTMNGARKVTAAFDPVPRFTITVIKEGTGSGTVLSEPKGIDCGATCEAEFEVGTVVTLRANADKGSVLVTWKGW